MNIENLIHLEKSDLTYMTVSQLHNLLAEAYSTLGTIEQYSITYIKLLVTIRNLELRIAEINYQPKLQTIYPKLN